MSSYNPKKPGRPLARLPCVPDGGHAPCAGRLLLRRATVTARRARRPRCGPCLGGPELQSGYALPPFRAVAFPRLILIDAVVSA